MGNSLRQAHEYVCALAVSGPWNNSEFEQGPSKPSLLSGKHGKPLEVSWAVMKKIVEADGKAR